MSERFLAAAVQMDSGADKGQNLRTAERLIREAAEKGAKLIALPENMNFIGFGAREQAEPVPGGETSALLSGLAREYGVWLLGGSFFENGGADRPFNTAPFFAPDGTLRFSYRKLHLFDVLGEHPGGSRESKNTAPGDGIRTAPDVLGGIGAAVCYDLRFPELFQRLALEGARTVVLPSNFTEGTGKAHWEILVRARAIETGCFVIAPAQAGHKPRFRAFGHSMIAGPWGEVLAEADGESEAVILAEIDPAKADEAREKIPALNNRRDDVYGGLPR